MAARMVIRDVGRVLDYPYSETDKLAKMIPMEVHITIPKALEQNREFKELYESNPSVKQLIDIAIKLEGLPRQASTHACGIVITKDPVDTYVPLYVNDGNISTQYTMNLLEELGLLKMDFLGLRTLTVISDTEKLVKQNRGIDVEYDKEMNDPKVYKLWANGESIGIFQFESQGMTNFMKELKPDCLEDIIAGVSLYRPGPMDQIPRYIKGKQNPGHNEYTHPALEPILNVTYGCMVYQEQVMQIVRELAGYSLGRADLVRRAMGKKKLDVMAKEREYFINGQVDENGNVLVPGCVRNGIDKESANKIFDEMAEFAKYAFNKSHAAAYSVVSYRTAYLKTYYPSEFMAATLNSFLGNLDKVPVYIYECKRLNIGILKPDINKSFTKFTVQDKKIRFGLGSIKNVGISAIETVISERERNGEFESFTDFCERIQSGTVNRKCIECLIKAGCFDEMNQTRATLLASYERILDTINNQGRNSMANQVTMFDLVQPEETVKYQYTVLKELDERELLAQEKEMIGIYISGHPLEKIKEAIQRQTNINSIQIKDLNGENAGNFKDGQNVKYAGTITSVKKKYTKRNTIMAFVTVEDLYGSAEIVVFDSVFSRCDNILVEENIVIVEGRLSIKEDEDARIIVQNIKEFSEENNTRDNIRKNTVIIDITELNETQKERLKGAIRFFSGDRVNMKISVLDKAQEKPCGAIYLTEEILNQFKEIVGEENVMLK